VLCNSHHGNLFSIGESSLGKQGVHQLEESMATISLTAIAAALHGLYGHSTMAHTHTDTQEIHTGMTHALQSHMF